MAIQMRRGNSADYDPTKLRAGEFAVSQDNQKIYICVSQGNVLEVATGSNLQQWIVQSEAWAVGEKNGVPVPSTDETYHNNSKYYAGIASAASLNPPYIGLNGNWYTYDTATEQYVDSGIDASITVDIADVTMLPTGSSPYVTNTGTSTDAIFHFFLPNSKGITSIVKTDTQGLVDTYTITYSDSTTSTFTVTNGEDGEDGSDGADGRGITSITRTASIGLDDIYTISYTDSTTSQYTVRNGCQWYTGTGISGKSPTPTVFPSSGITNANLNDLYLNTTECAVYQCEYDGAPSVAKWAYICTIKGDPGSGTGDMTKAVYDPNNHGYVDKAAGVTDGTNVLSYADIENGLGGSDEELIRDTVGWTGKNLLSIPSSVVTTTLNGVTFTVTRNADGGITEIDVDTNGSSATANAILNLNTSITVSDACVLTGCPAGGHDSGGNNYLLVAYDGTNYLTDSGDGKDIPANTYSVYIIVYSGKTLSHKKFYPMLRKATVTDSTYEPYHASVEDYMLPQSVMNVVGAKNLLELFIQEIKQINTSGTWNNNVYSFRGVDWTVNSNMTITASGSATGGNSVLNLSDKTRVIDNLLFSGCPKGGAADKYYLRASKTSTYDDKGDGVLINDTINYIACIITSGYSIVSSITFSPMLRLAEFTDDTYEPYAMTNKQLTDAVDDKIDNPVSKSDGQVLTYDGTNQVWKAQTPSSGVTTLAALTDVTVTTPSSGQALTYNGSGWVNSAYDYTNLSNKPTIPTVDQNYSSTSTNAQSGTAVAGAIQGKANTSALDSWTTTATVSSGTVSFSGIDDSAGTNGYEPFPNITSNSTNKNPTFQISSISGTGTSSMSVTFTTDADNGTTVKLRILK